MNGGKSKKIDRTNSTNRAIVLMKEGKLYKPILRKDKNGSRGIFKMDDKMITYLIKSGESLIR